MLSRQGQADDGNAQNQGHDQVENGQFEARKQNPDDIHDDRQCSAGWFFFSNFAAKRRQREAGQFEALDAEGNADDRDAKNDSA